MKGLIVDGPNVGQQIEDSRLRVGGVYKIIDPSERNFKEFVHKDPNSPIKVNTYWVEPANPFARAYGFDYLLRFSH